MQNLSIIIPTFNERENVVKLISLIKKQKRNLRGLKLEIVVVDDNSFDKTSETVKKKFPEVKLIVRKDQKGLGTAIRDGILASNGEVIVGMDADLNHDPNILPKLISNLENSDLVIASRFIPGGGMDEKQRYLGTFLFNLTLRCLLAFPSTDNLSGYYAIRRTKLKRLNIKKIYYGYGDYHLRLVFYAKKKGYKITEVPVFYSKRVYGESKSNLWWMVFTYFKEAVRLVSQ